MLQPSRGDGGLTFLVGDSLLALELILKRDTAKTKHAPANIVGGQQSSVGRACGVSRVCNVQGAHSHYTDGQSTCAALIFAASSFIFCFCARLPCVATAALSMPRSSNAAHARSSLTNAGPHPAPVTHLIVITIIAFLALGLLVHDALLLLVRAATTSDRLRARMRVKLSLAAAGEWMDVGSYAPTMTSRDEDRDNPHGQLSVDFVKLKVTWALTRPSASESALRL